LGELVHYGIRYIPITASANFCYFYVYQDPKCYFYLYHFGYMIVVLKNTTDLTVIKDPNICSTFISDLFINKRSVFTY